MDHGGDYNLDATGAEASRRGLGAVLLRKPAKLARLVAGIAAGSPLPVTVKIRTGESASKINCLQVCTASTGPYERESLRLRHVCPLACIHAQCPPFCFDDAWMRDGQQLLQLFIAISACSLCQAHCSTCPACSIYRIFAFQKAHRLHDLEMGCSLAIFTALIAGRHERKVGLSPAA